MITRFTASIADAPTRSKGFAGSFPLRVLFLAAVTASGAVEPATSATVTPHRFANGMTLLDLAAEDLHPSGFFNGTKGLPLSGETVEEAGAFIAASGITGEDVALAGGGDATGWIPAAAEATPVAPVEGLPGPGWVPVIGPAPADAWVPAAGDASESVEGFVPAAYAFAGWDSAIPGSGGGPCYVGNSGYGGVPDRCGHPAPLAAAILQGGTTGATYPGIWSLATPQQVLRPPSSDLPAPIPLPATGWLLLGGLTLAGLRRRR